MRDHLQHIRDLPVSILTSLGQLIVNRIGKTAHATMFTRNIIGHVSPQKYYQLCDKKKLLLQPAVTSFKSTYVAKHTIPPVHAVFKGTWKKKTYIENTHANILGGMGALLLEKTTLRSPIPILEATRENLAFYNAQLLHVGETVQFETHNPLPITHVSIGHDYVDHYLSQTDHGGGEYIEYHNEPHFWAPQSPDCKGHILLGRQEDQNFYFTAFSIPFGKAIYLSPYTLHSDAYLVGDHLVVYAIAEHFSTVLFMSEDYQPQRLNFTNAM